MQYALARLERGEEVQRWPIEIDEVIIGRSEKATICIDGGTVSRQHIRLWLEDGIVAAEDLGSRNGFKLNGVRTRSGGLREGDRLEVSGYIFMLIQKDAPVVSVNEGTAPKQSENPEAQAFQKRALQNPDAQLNAALTYAARLQPYMYDREALFKHIANIILKDVPVQRCFILAREAGQRGIQVVHNATRTGNEEGPAPDTAIIEHVFGQRKPVFVGDVSAPPTTGDTGKPKPGTICVPLMSGQSAVGVLYVDTGWEASRLVSANFESMKAYGLAFGMIVDQSAQLDGKLDAARREGVNETTSALGKCFYEQLHDLRVAMDSGEGKKLERAVRRAEMAVQQMIGIASLKHLSRRPHKIGEVVSKVLTEIKGELESAGVQIDVRSDARAVAFVDAYQIERVLYAILAQCMDSKAKSIAITTENKTDGCYIIIKDDGEGMAPGLAAGLSASVLDNTSLGMRGLMFAHAFGSVEAHGGKMRVRAEENDGMTVMLILPAQEGMVVR